MVPMFPPPSPPPEVVTPAPLPEVAKPPAEVDKGLMGQSGEYTVTLFQLSREELTEARPDLKDRIQNLKDTDIEAIALQAEKAMQDIYRMVLALTVASYVQ